MKLLTRFYITAIILFSIQSLSFAQHCPFDNAAILVVDISDLLADSEIDSLRITLTDTNFTVLKNYDGYELIFKKNADKTTEDWYPNNLDKVRYSFAEDNYILIFPNDAKFYKDTFIKVEYLKVDVFEMFTYKVNKNDVFDVHENIGNWTEINNLFETPKPRDEFHHTIKVELKK